MSFPSVFKGLSGKSSLCVQFLWQCNAAVR